jgi:cytochrome c553
VTSLRLTLLPGAWRGNRAAGFPIAAAFVFTALTFSGMPAAHAGLEEGRAKAQVCAACHGADGNSTIDGIPSLAGQPKQFIVMALYMFREGRRKNEAMTPFTEKLSNADLNDLAQYFSSQKLATPARTAPADLVTRARAVAEQNNCVACHTATLTGQQHIPRLAGQNKTYTLEQLKNFKAGTRGDFDGTMTSAAQALVPADLELLAEYLSTLNAP